MRYYPVFLDLEGRSVIIVGGGAEAAQKLRLMAKTPAKLVVIAPFAEEELCAEIDATGATWLAREFDADDLHGAALVGLTSSLPGFYLGLRYVSGEAICLLQPAVVKSGKIRS